jgi:Domain of unknown function (DUF6532)
MRMSPTILRSTQPLESPMCRLSEGNGVYPSTISPPSSVRSSSLRSTTWWGKHCLGTPTYLSRIRRRLFVACLPGWRRLFPLKLCKIWFTRMNVLCGSLPNWYFSSFFSVSVISDCYSFQLLTRVSNIRGQVKKAVMPKVKLLFAIPHDSEECKTYIKEILKTGDYIYPFREASNHEFHFFKTLTTFPQNGAVNRTAPFKHPIILSTLRDFIFSASRGSIAERHPKHFTSSITSAPQCDELEIPGSLVCLIATAVRFFFFLFFCRYIHAAILGARLPSRLVWGLLKEDRIQCRDVRGCVPWT